MTFDPDYPIFPPGIPEEYKEQILEHRNHHQAHMQDNTHAVKYFMEGLSEDDLKALDMICVALIADPQYNGAYFRGQITQLGAIKYGICPCGQDHDPTEAFQLPEVTRPGTPQVPNQETHRKGRLIEDVDLPTVEGETAWEPGLPDSPEDFGRSVESMERDAMRGVDDAELSRSGLLFKYNLLEDNLGQLHCGGCNTIYQSLEDRMLKPPGIAGCDSCQQKEKFG